MMTGLAMTRHKQRMRYFLALECSDSKLVLNCFKISSKCSWKNNGTAWLISKNALYAFFWVVWSRLEAICGRINLYKSSNAFGVKLSVIIDNAKSVNMYLR